MDQPERPPVDFASITADIIASYVANNSVYRADLPAAIASVHEALRGLVAPKQAEAESRSQQSPSASP
jgi:predicted transcriptional regulator